MQQMVKILMMQFSIFKPIDTRVIWSHCSYTGSSFLAKNRSRRRRRFAIRAVFGASGFDFWKCYTMLAKYTVFHEKVADAF